MATSTRIKAQDIKFLIGATEYACDATNIELASQDAPGDVQTFCEMTVGQEWTLTLEGITSGDDTSLFTIAPNGNATATPDEPHYTGTVKFDALPPLSLTSNETSTFSVALTVVNTPHDPANDVWYGVEIVTA